jgi:hypothetical protein
MSSLYYKKEIVLAGASVGSRIQELCEWLVHNKIEMICWDFDQTIINIHSGGCIKDVDLNSKIEVLAKQVSPDFRLLVSYLQFKHPQIKQSVVSFADNFDRNKSSSSLSSTTPSSTVALQSVGGTDLICAVLKQAFGWPRPEFHIVSFYPDVANSLQEFKTRVPNNKSVHMKIVQERAKLQPHQILLVDNDINNCRNAIMSGCRAWFVKNQQGFDAKTIVPVAPM